jgi:hypothetical protein
LNFKVGDRVEVLEPADGVLDATRGPGTVVAEADNEGDIRVRRDGPSGSDEPAYVYGPEQLRPLGRTPA